LRIGAASSMSAGVSSISLTRAAEELERRFGAQIEAAYLPGKTAFRNALCDRLGLSMVESEDLCDSLERRHLIRFDQSPDYGARWTIVPRAG
jgi:hypothetical protein